ncbi:unnamed protein product [Prorocentrum cordatum]|uniref:Uncharacterized protein n=1 Tax=Prorocentrum cordatum TaxID=2364126 RepID=A0ABN9T6C2_9DINO|nr:unnamed protein product [Polarella glacialis]
MGQAACCSECSQRAPGPAGGPSASAPAEGEARSPAPGRGRSPGQHDAWCVPEESDKLNTTLALASGSSKPYPHVAARKAPGKLDAIDEGYTVEPGSWHHALEEPGSSTKAPLRRCTPSGAMPTRTRSAAELESTAGDRTRRRWCRCGRSLWKPRRRLTAAACASSCADAAIPASDAQAIP